MALNSCSVNTVTKQSSKGLALCSVPMMGALGSPARHAAVLQAAPCCLPLQRALSLQQEPWQQADGCLSASTVPFCALHVSPGPIAAGFGYNVTAAMLPQVCHVCHGCRPNTTLKSKHVDLCWTLCNSSLTCSYAYIAPATFFWSWVYHVCCNTSATHPHLPKLCRLLC